MDRKIIIAMTLLMAGPLGAATPQLISVKQGTHTMVAADCFSPSISDDGAIVSFESFAKLLPNDRNNKSRDVYVCDRRTGKLSRIIIPGKGRSNGGAAVSGDGRSVAFHSYLPIDRKLEIPQSAGIYLFDLETSSVTWSMEGAATQRLEGESIFPILSQRGNKILFTSNSEQILPGKGGGISQIYLFDRDKEEFRLLSRGPNGVASNRTCAHPELSMDETTLTFLSAATNFEPELPAGSLSFHLYMLDRRKGTSTRIDALERGLNPKEGVVSGFSMDDAGHKVVVEVRPRDVENPLNILTASNLFLFDRVSNTSKLLTTGIFANKSRSPSVSGDGRFMAFHLVGKGIVVYEFASNRWLDAAEGSCASPAFSGDGRVIAFEKRDKKMKNIYVVENPFNQP